MAYPWIKFHTQTLDDPRLGALSNAAWRRYHELLLLAGECAAGGRLVYDGHALTAAELAWRLRVSARRMLADLQALQACGLATCDDDGYRLPAFARSQERLPAGERERWRMQKQRQRLRPSAAAAADVSADMSAPANADSEVVRAPDEDREVEEKREEAGVGEGEAGTEKARPARAGVRISNPANSAARDSPAAGAPADRARPAGGDPLEIYRQACGHAPPPGRGAEIRAAVQDPQRWRASIEHWLFHGWNPGNVTGQLDLYRRGGPAGCKSCRPVDALVQELTTVKDAHDALDCPGPEDAGRRLPG